MKNYQVAYLSRKTYKGGRWEVGCKVYPTRKDAIIAGNDMLRECPDFASRFEVLACDAFA